MDRYILDFYCAEHRLAVEADGGQHGDSKAVTYDVERTDRLNNLGVRVVRFPDDEVLKFPDEVAEAIYRHLTEPILPSPQPSPGVPGEGEEMGIA